uniref:Uncharacterized protein n=1 Tax=Timema tahoe TaxID=61484 RepID=A0A7R9IDQ5_9NEOP|nr:unnamed protein product [Timema tahoe]
MCPVSTHTNDATVSSFICCFAVASQKGDGKKSPSPADDDLVSSVFKKSAPNNKLTLYLASRDLVISEKKIDKLQGVLLVDPDYLQDRKFQATLRPLSHGHSVRPSEVLYVTRKDRSTREGMDIFTPSGHGQIYPSERRKLSDLPATNPRATECNE